MATGTGGAVASMDLTASQAGVDVLRDSGDRTQAIAEPERLGRGGAAVVHPTH